MTHVPISATEAQAIFLQLTQSTRVIQDKSEPSEKSDEVRHLKNDVPEIII